MILQQIKILSISAGGFVLSLAHVESALRIILLVTTILTTISIWNRDRRRRQKENGHEPKN